MAQMTLHRHHHHRGRTLQHWHLVSVLPDQGHRAGMLAPCGGETTAIPPGQVSGYLLTRHCLRNSMRASCKRRCAHRQPCHLVLLWTVCAPVRPPPRERQSANQYIATQPSLGGCTYCAENVASCAGMGAPPPGTNAATFGLMAAAGCGGPPCTSHGRTEPSEIVGSGKSRRRHAES